MLLSFGSAGFLVVCAVLDMLLSFGGAGFCLDTCCEVLRSVQPLGGLLAFIKPQLGGVLGRGGGTFWGLVSEISNFIFFF
jgi:hypothetical protein